MFMQIRSTDKETLPVQAYAHQIITLLSRLQALGFGVPPLPCRPCHKVLGAPLAEYSWIYTYSMKAQ